MSLVPGSLVFGSTRRAFVLGGAALATALGSGAARARTAGNIRIGYATLTWGDENARQALADVAEVGYRGVQLRLQSLPLFATPQKLKAELTRGRLTFVCLSGGSMNPDRVHRAAAIDKFLVGARFAKAAGAQAIQVNSANTDGATVGKAELMAFSETLNELGKRTAAIGLPLGFHTQANQYGRTAAQIDTIMAATDPAYVKLILDTGHHVAADGDPARAIRDHGKRLLLIHLKDVVPRPQVPAGQEPYEFLELGRGRVDFKSVFAALSSIDWKGWAIIEMRPYTVREGVTAKDGALTNKAYLAKTLGLTI